MEVEVLYAYEPKEQDELRLCVGHVIRKVVKQEAGWYRGTSRQGDTGVFPDNFVQILSKDVGGSGRSSASPDTNNTNNMNAPSPVNNTGITVPATKREGSGGGGGVRQCRAVFSYAPQHEDELQLAEGDVLQLLQEVEEGWWKGQLNGQIGMFPSNFVEEIVIEETTRTTTRNSKEGMELRNKNNINANINNDGEAKPRPVTGQGYGVREADLRKELNKKLAAAAAVAANGNSGTRKAASSPAPAAGTSPPPAAVNGLKPGVSPARLSGGSVVGINAGNVLHSTPASTNGQQIAGTRTSAFQPLLKHKDGKTVAADGNKTKAERDRFNSAIEREAAKGSDDRPAKGSNRSPLSNYRHQSGVSKKGSTSAPPEPSPTLPPPQLPPKPVRELARALYPYTAEHEDELSLKEGDIITLLSKDLEDKGWWKGELAGRVGVFPDNFVQVVAADDTPKPPRPDKPTGMGSRASSVGSPNTSASSSPTPTLAAKDSAAPPLPDKKLLPPPSSSTNQQQQQITTLLTNGHTTIESNLPAIMDGGQKLHHMNQQRPRGPNRRPPSGVFKENMRNSSGDSESSSMSIDSPSSQNFSVTDLPVPDVAGSRISPLPSKDAMSQDPISKIVLRANSQKNGAPPSATTTVAAANGSAPAPVATSPVQRPSTMIGGVTANQGPAVPWLQELNAKQKRKSLLLEMDKDGAPSNNNNCNSSPTSPPVSAKPNVGNIKKPQQQQQLPTLQHSENQLAKLTAKQKPGSQPHESLLSSSKLQHPAIPAHQSKIQSQVKQPSSKPLDVTSASIDTNTSNNKTRRTGGTQHFLDEPDIVSSASSRKSSTASASVATGQVAGSTGKQQELRNGSSAVKPVSTAVDIIADTVSQNSSGSELHLYEGPTTDVVVSSDSVTPHSSTLNNADIFSAPTIAPINEPYLNATAHLQHTSKSISVSSSVSSHRSSQNSPPVAKSPHHQYQSAPVHITSKDGAQLPPPSTNTSLEMLSKKASDQIIIPDNRIPQDIIEDAKALDKVNAILDKLLPKVSALEERLEEQKRDHARQLQLLTAELDEERKKRACLEIEMERLKKMLLTYTAHV